MINFGDIIRRTVAVAGGRPAVTCGDRTIDYATLYSRSCRLANALAAVGLKPGDRVASLVDNSLETPEHIIGLALGGYVRSTLYAQNAVDAHLYMLNLIEASALIVHERYYKELADRLPEVPSIRTVLVLGSAPAGTTDYEEALASASADDPMVGVDNAEPHIIRFSAGTTGRAKGIVHSTTGWLAMGNELALALPRMDDDDVYLAAGPLSHAACLPYWPVVAAGARVVVMPAFDPAEVLRLVEQERVTFMLLVPTMIQMVTSQPDAGSRDLSSLRVVMYGAAPITERALADARAVWGEINYQLYGQSEALPATTLSPRHHSGAQLRSAGRPTPNSLVKVVGDDDQVLPPGEVGEVLVNSPGNMHGLWRDPEGTRERITPDGFVRSRDLGYLDADGFLYLADRKEDMIISGGFNIWPAELENALAGHPAVAEAGVVGVPHPKWAETPAALVVLRPGADAPTEAELIAWCREKLGGAKKPSFVRITTEPLPKSPVGKVLRRAIREQFSTEDGSDATPA